MPAPVTELEPVVAPGDHLELREIEGPTAFGGSVRRFVVLTYTIAVTEFKLRFYGSVLGYFWQLLRPLLLFATLFIVFTKIVKIGGKVPNYEVILLMNIVLFNYFSEGASAVTAVVDQENLVRKIQVPRLAIPLSVTLTATFNVFLNFIVIIVFVLVSGIDPTWRWVEIPLLIGMMGTIAAGCAMLISALYVRFRDVKPIWEVTLQMLFYASPVIYVLATLDIPQGVKEGLALSPIAAVLIQMRHAVIDPSAPSAADAVGGPLMLLIPIGITVGLLILGLQVFRREAPRIAEEL